MFSWFRACVMVFAVLSSPFSYSQTLWTKGEYGMTVDQVRSAFPGTIDTPKPEHLRTGAVGLLTLPGIQISSQPFHANFYFVAGKLVQVTLSLENEKVFGATLVTFKDIEEILRAKYGPEITHEISPGVVSMAKASWMSGSVNIGLLAMAVANNPAIMNITYQVRVSQEANKL